MYTLNKPTSKLGRGTYPLSNNERIIETGSRKSEHPETRNNVEKLVSFTFTETPGCFSVCFIVFSGAGFTTKIN